MYLKERYESVPKEQLKDFEAFSKSFLRINGKGLTYFDTKGDLPLLILIPGSTGDALVFWEYINKLKIKYRIIAFDYPKEGDLEAFIDSMYDVVESNGIESFGIVGFSTGGVIAQRMAYKYKDHLMKLILIHSYTKSEELPSKVLKVHTKSLIRLIKSLKTIRYKAMQKNFSKNLTRSIDRSELENQAFIGALYNDILMNTTKDQMSLNYQLILDFWQGEDLDKKGLTCPVMVIESDADQDVKTEDRTDLKILYPQRKTLILDGTTSFSLVKNFNKISDEILNF